MADNRKVEFSTEITMNGHSQFRKVYWRIVPSELNWWDRKFHNRWHKMWWYYKDGNYTDLFSVEEFKFMRSSISTVSDVEKWEEEGDRKREMSIEHESRYRDWRDAINEKNWDETINNSK